MMGLYEDPFTDSLLLSVALLINSESSDPSLDSLLSGPSSLVISVSSTARSLLFTYELSSSSFATISHSSSCISMGPTSSCMLVTLPTQSSPVSSSSTSSREDAPGPAANIASVSHCSSIASFRISACFKYSSSLKIPEASESSSNGNEDPSDTLTVSVSFVASPKRESTTSNALPHAGSSPPASTTSSLSTSSDLPSISSSSFSASSRSFISLNSSTEYPLNGRR
mmetsp:Transcript_24454/g.44233  ORF Transcript_24454/g.44233 Transcript_24454/m.44233 type:complete len:226 (-) Transcript_24454:1840-2517(-)